MLYISRLTNGEWHTEVEEGLASRDPFAWCSFSKLITAILVVNHLLESREGLSRNYIFGSKRFQLSDLLAHRSGLPKIPDDLMTYETYDSEKAKAFIARTSFYKKGFLYSNLGYGILGEFLKDFDLSISDLFEKNWLRGIPPLKSITTNPPKDNPKRYWKRSDFWICSGGIISTIEDFELFALSYLMSSSFHDEFYSQCLDGNLLTNRGYFLAGPGFAMENSQRGNVFQLQGSNHFFLNNFYFNPDIKNGYLIISDSSVNQDEFLKENLSFLGFSKRP